MWDPHIVGDKGLNLVRCGTRTLLVCGFTSFHYLGIITLKLFGLEAESESESSYCMKRNRKEPNGNPRFYRSLEAKRTLLGYLFERSVRDRPGKITPTRILFFRETSVSSGIMGTQFRAPWNLPYITALYRIEGFKRGP